MHSNTVAYLVRQDLYLEVFGQFLESRSLGLVRSSSVCLFKALYSEDLVACPLVAVISR